MIMVDEFNGLLFHYIQVLQFERPTLQQPNESSKTVVDIYHTQTKIK
jgi:hypothetical protein